MECSPPISAPGNRERNEGDVKERVVDAQVDPVADHGCGYADGQAGGDHQGGPEPG